jgi:Tat protein secretion system quality control protein TatD with DNase activity
VVSGGRARGHTDRRRERSTKLGALVAALPTESIVLEPDAPDLTVTAHRGERNSLEYLPEVLAALAAVRHEDPVALANQTTANACRVLGLLEGRSTHILCRMPPLSAQ